MPPCPCSVQNIHCNRLEIEKHPYDNRKLSHQRQVFYTFKVQKSSHSFLDFLCAVKMPNNQFIQYWFLYLRTLEHLLSGKAWMSLRRIWIHQIRKCRPTFVGSTEGTWEPPIRGSWKDGSPRVGDYHDHQSENSQHLSIERRRRRSMTCKFSLIFFFNVCLHWFVSHLFRQTCWGHQLYFCKRVSEQHPASQIFPFRELK